MKPGRNDLCPCGSGKKYKQCCLKSEKIHPENEFLWLRIRRAIEGSPMRILDFSSSYYGREALLEAWDDFMPWEDEEFTMDTPHMTIFMPWFYYEWTPDPKHTAVKREALDGRTLGQAYLDKKAHQIDPLLARYIEQCCANPFSFYDVMAVRYDDGYTLRDIFTGEDIKVTEHAGSRQSQVGDILFGKVAKVDEVAMLEASAPFMFPPMEKSAVLKLRKKMERGKQSITPQRLRKYQHDMLDIYHDIVDRLLNPPMPRLHNTDGDPMLPHRLMYEIESPSAAFEALSKLCLTDSAEELLADAKLDKKGELLNIEFSWQKRDNDKNKSWDNTILGHIKIEGRTMNIEVNSESRAQKIRELVEERLPSARYKTTVIESLQAMLAREEEKGATSIARQRQNQHDELNSHPEVQAQITKMMRQHYRTWPESKIPILNNKTPLQAVKTRDGREMVEALLLDIERRSAQQTPPLDPAIIAELRERLGL
ncbi:MAG: SEC-C domain-containing protein [Gallionella sp.]